MSAPRRGLQVDEGQLYWNEIVSDAQGNALGMKVFSAPKGGGGAVRELGDWSDYQAPGLVVDASFVYWLNAGKLVRVRKDGSGRGELAVPDVEKIDPGPLLDAGDAVLVGSHACRFLARVPKDGSPGQVWPVSTHAATGGNTGLETDGSVYYCASGNFIETLDSRSGEVKELVTYAGKAGPLRKVGGDLFWADSDNPELKGAALVMLAAGARQPAAVGPAYGGTGRLLHDPARHRLYWITGLDYRGCDAVAFDLETRQTSFLARDLNRYGDTAQDADYIYWLASNAVMRAHK